MADTRISKIKVRKGNFAALPMLDPGEVGYATDNQRLFIGNTTVNVGTGNGVITTFVVPNTIPYPNGVIAVFDGGTQVNAADYSILGTTLTFATAPTGAVTVNFNSEISLERHETYPSSIQLPANGNNTATGFSIDTTSYNIVIIDYTLASANGVRVGQIRMATDNSGLNLAAIDDNYTETAAVDITFSADISVANTLRLMYTDGANAITKFKYTYQLWNSN